MTARQCQKVHFRNEPEAMLALSRRNAKGKGEVRHYFCPACRAWHLTSQPTSTHQRKVGP